MRKTEKILWVVCSILSLALYFSVMLQKWGLSLFGEDVDYSRFGNWSDAISGIATSVAIIVALVGIWIQYSVTKSAETAKRLEEETSIYFWLKSNDIVNDKDEFIGRTWDLIIQNLTKVPIYSWVVKFETYSDHLCNFQKRPLLPNENLFNLPFLDNLEPGKTPMATLYFEGNSERYWSRNIKGQPREIKINEMNCNHNSLNYV